MSTLYLQNVFTEPGVITSTLNRRLNPGVECRINQVLHRVRWEVCNRSEDSRRLVASNQRGPCIISVPTNVTCNVGNWGSVEMFINSPLWNPVNSGFSINKNHRIYSPNDSCSIHICNMIKGNESDVKNIDFELQTKIGHIMLMHFIDYELQRIGIISLQLDVQCRWDWIKM